jgi:parallel beta-helix repeat protein
MPSRFYKAFEYPKPVGKGVADMRPGSFYYDLAATTLYVWLADGADPNRHVVEASTRRRLFQIGKPYVRLQGLAFRHSNISAFVQQGAAVELGPYSVLEGCDVQWTDFAGVSLGYLQTGAQVFNSNISNNGNSGINGPGSYAFRVANTTMNNNNYRNFNPLWHAGGLKATTKAYGKVEGNEVAGNNGSGIWFDYANGGQAIVVRNNFIYDNGPVDSAVFVEVSRNVEVSNNLIVNNARRGVYLSGSDNTRVFNNTIYGTRGYAGIELGGLPRAGATLTGNRVYNNIVSHGSSRYDLIMMPPNGAGIADNTSNFNNFYRAGEPIRLSYERMHGDLPGWQKSTGMDAKSVSIDPRFSTRDGAPAASAFEIQPDSPLIGAGTRADADAADPPEARRPHASIGARGFGTRREADGRSSRRRAG